MPRPRREAPGGFVYHVLNRANGRREIFQTSGDYRAFADALAEIQDRVSMRILAWCLMPNHWHLLLWPEHDGDLSNYMRLLTLTHTQRWHAFRRSAGTGHLYQGRFKSFVVQDDTHFLTVCRYVEANALRAKLVERAENWRWGSLWQQYHHECGPRLHEWPVARPRDWARYVNEVSNPADLDALRRSARCGAPYGEARWVEKVAGELGLQCTLRRRGRPPKDIQEGGKGS